MKAFDFYIAGLNREVSVLAENSKAARKWLWETGLDDAEKNAVEYIELL